MAAIILSSSSLTRMVFAGEYRRKREYVAILFRRRAAVRKRFAQKAAADISHDKRISARRRLPAAHFDASSKPGLSVHG